jgi:hypothetical protein
MGGGLSPSNGFRAGISYHATPVDMESVGFNVESGNLVHVSLRRREILRLKV